MKIKAAELFREHTNQWRERERENENYIPKCLFIKYHLVCLLSTYYKGCAITRKQASESDCHLYCFDR